MDDNALTVTQHQKLKYLEAQISKGASDIYQALRLIHDEKLYRGAHQTFEDYCLARWGMGRSYAHRLLQHGQVLRLAEAELSPIGNKPPEAENGKTFAASELLKEAHTREVSGLPEAEQASILAEAIEMAPKDASGKPQVTAKLVRDIREARSKDPFTEDGTDSDPFGEDSISPERQEADTEELPPRPPRNGKEASEGPSRTPEEEFALQKSKTIKTVEAAMRAFDDLNRLQKRPEWHETAIEEAKSLLAKAKNWKYAGFH